MGKRESKVITESYPSIDGWVRRHLDPAPPADRWIDCTPQPYQRAALKALQDERIVTIMWPRRSRDRRRPFDPALTPRVAKPDPEHC